LLVHPRNPPFQLPNVPVAPWAAECSGQLPCCSRLALSDGVVLKDTPREIGRLFGAALGFEWTSMISTLCTHRGRCTRCGCPYRDSRRGKRLVIDRTVSRRPDLSATAAVKNVARPNAFSHSMLLPERAIGTIGLKSAAIATKTTAHEYFPARIACLTSR